MNFLSISVLLSEISYFLLKREIFSEFHQKCFKTTEKHGLAVSGSFWGEKLFLLIIVPFYCFEQKQLFTPNPNFPLVFLRFKHVEKCNLSVNFEFLSEIVTFWNKKDVFNVLPQIFYKTTERHSLAVCGSLWGEKQFLLIFVPFYWLNKKQLFKQIQIFLRIYPFSNLLRKINFLINSVHLSEIVTFD